MPQKVFCLCLLAALATPPARAATLEIEITASGGQPAQNAVVAVAPAGGPFFASHLPTEAVIDQRKETFLPLVTIIRKGGRVVFTNNDATMHHVYSFSPIKQFEFEMDEGHRSDPVMFDKAGVVSIGCNIHDHMITYVYVADAPWAALTDAKGHAQISELATGNYRVQVWHPQLLPGRAPPATFLAVNGTTKFSLALPLLAVSSSRHMHMGSY